MEILYYNELNTKGVKKQFEKVGNFLKKGDFKSADVKKMPNTNFYRAKLDQTNRLLFKFASYKDKKYLLFLEVIHQHRYEKSRFLRGAKIQESAFKTIRKPENVVAEDIQKMVYLNDKQATFHILDKVISLDDEQQEIFSLSTPLIIIGSAGSGKTALTLEKMKYLRGNIAYISLSSYLVENSQTTYYSNAYENEKQEVDFLSFREYIESIKLPKGKEINYKAFERWINRYKQAYKIREPYKLFEEFKGVLTGSIIDKAYLSREDYVNLGVKQSIYLKDEREKVYDIFEKYIAFLNEKKYYDANIVSHNYLEKVSPTYDFIVVDEVQDLTNIQLMLILKSLKKMNNFLLSGDSNQIVHPNFFSWSKLKSMFYTSKMTGSFIRILKTNYRNSIQITKISNDLLKIKNARFGSIDKESTYLIDTVSSVSGEINFFQENEKIKKELNTKTQSSTKFAVLVMNNEQKEAVKRYFKTPLVFSIQEAKGLEYENIILLNFISDNEKIFREITSGVSPDDLLDENMIFARTKDKSNKELEAFKFYINSLYVAFTRAVKNLYIIEKNKKHDLLELLQVRKTQDKLQLDTQASDDNEWLAEAKRLELQGKLEQAREIRDRIKGVIYLTPKEVEKLKKRAFNDQLTDLEARKQLFEYAQTHAQIDLIKELKRYFYKPAKQFMAQYEKDRKRYFSMCKNNQVNSVEKLVVKYGVNFRAKDDDMTGLLIAVEFGSQRVYDYLMKNEADITLVDNIGQTPLQTAMRAYGETLKAKMFTRIYPQLTSQYIRIKADERILKISIKTMEYFLLNMFIAIRNDIIRPNDPPALRGLRMDDVMEYIEDLPDNILPDYRQKRQYVNSILAKNEVNRADKYNKKIFVRKSRGVYNLNPNMEVLNL
ncbi:MAG: UvrD-helicase domain-containing protein [Chitinophagales bacterium]